MAAIEVNASGSVCRKCGVAYGRLKGNFPVSYGQLYKGVAYLPYCRECVEGLYNSYHTECGDAKMAARQLCRKLDLYWNEKQFDAIEKTSASRSIMTAYINRVNGVKNAGKSYDDTLREEGTMWDAPVVCTVSTKVEPIQAAVSSTKPIVDVPDEVVEFWGSDFEPEFVLKLDKRYKQWTDGVDLDKGSVSLYKQICILEEMISKDAAEGKPVDKNMNMLNTLLGSLNQKPVQKKTESDTTLDSTPLGVWIRRWENQRPIPEPDPEFEDADGIIRYILIWFAGHLGKMVGIKNHRSALYEAEIERLRVDRPEYADEDDDTLLLDIFGDSSEEVVD